MRKIYNFLYGIIIWVLVEYRKFFIKKLCKLFGHKNFLYNFPSMANRCICPRCGEKFELDLSDLEWKKVENFSSNIGTDEEIIKRWSHQKF